MKDHRGPVVATAENHKVIDCAACGYAHLDPLPDPSELARMYEAEYYEELNPAWLAKDDSESDFWRLEHDDKLDAWSDLLGKATGRLVDVGCSGGLLLEHAVSRGWQAEGIEPSATAAAHARDRGLTIHQARFEEVELRPGSVDVVHAKLVLEHLFDPVEFLDWAREALMPGGILTIQVPNDFNQLQLEARERLEEKEWWVAPPFHLNYFSFATLERTLAARGFDLAGRDATFPMEWFLLMGENYVGDETVGLDAHKRRMRLELALEDARVRRAFHAFLAAHNIGREAIVHARRREGAARV